MTKIATTASANNGVTTAIIEPPIEAIFSPVATTGFPKPPVNFKEVNLVSPVPAWMIPALPPPTNKAKIHCHVGSILTIVDALTKVPAIMADGVEIVSKRLSM